MIDSNSVYCYLSLHAHYCGGDHLRLEQLHYFDILVQEGSFNKASAKLHIAQPTLTASIKSMEKELNKTLLLRDSRGISLTEDGQKVLKFSKAISFLYHNLLEELNNSEQPLVGNLSIVTSKFFSEIILETFLPMFHEQFPAIKVRLIENEFYTYPQHLATTDCKFAIATRLQQEEEDPYFSNLLQSDEAFFDTHYHYLPLFTDVLGFCLAKHHPMANSPNLYPVTIFESEYQSTVFPFEQSYISEKILLSSGNPQLHINAMLQENAYCNIPYFVYQKLFAQEDTLTYRSYQNNITITYYLIYPVNHTLTAAEAKFIDELQQYLTEIKFK